jgi:hypothetical protein
MLFIAFGVGVDQFTEMRKVGKDMLPGTPRSPARQRPAASAGRAFYHGRIDFRRPLSNHPGKDRHWGWQSANEDAHRVLERALEFERLAGSEQNQIFKAELLKQAEAYRKLAAKRAREYGLPMPSAPDHKPRTE